MGKLLGGIVLFLLIAYFIAGLVIGFVMTNPIPKDPEISATVISEDYEDIEFQTPDGVSLKGWFFKSTSEKVVIFIPGVYENRVNEAYDTKNIAKFLLEQGYNILLYDPRGIGQSEQVRISFASKDGNDVLGAVEYLKMKGFNAKKIGVIGDSLGAINVVYNAPLFHEVGALIADSPATNLKPLVSRQLVNEKHIPTFLHFGIYAMGKLFLGVDIPAVRPIESVTKVPNREFLFIHGTNDDFIVPEESVTLHKLANPNSKLVLFENAEHVQTFKTNPVLYKEAVLTFLEDQL